MFGRNEDYDPMSKEPDPPRDSEEYYYLHKEGELVTEQEVMEPWQLAQPPYMAMLKDSLGL